MYFFTNMCVYKEMSIKISNVIMERFFSFYCNVIVYLKNISVRGLAYFRSTHWVSASCTLSALSQFPCVQCFLFHIYPYSECGFCFSLVLFHEIFLGPNKLSMLWPVKLPFSRVCICCGCRPYTTTTRITTTNWTTTSFPFYFVIKTFTICVC